MNSSPGMTEYVNNLPYPEANSLYYIFVCRYIPYICVKLIQSLATSMHVCIRICVLLSLPWWERKQQQQHTEDIDYSTTIWNPNLCSSWQFIQVFFLFLLSSTHLPSNPAMGWLFYSGCSSAVRASVCMCMENIFESGPALCFLEWNRMWVFVRSFPPHAHGKTKENKVVIYSRSQTTIFLNFVVFCFLISAEQEANAL